MKNFHCIGWSVDLDKETYQKYKKINNLDLKPIFDKMVNRKHNQKSDGSYGKIKMEDVLFCHVQRHPD